MKKTILAILSVISFSSYAQNTVRVNEGAHQVFYNVNSKGAGRALTYDEITGSPYVTKDFKVAKVADDYEKVPVRYNSYKDEIEFQKDGTTMVLPNEPKFSRIEILSPKQTLVWADTGDDMKGYFFELAGGKNALYKKVKTRFNDLVPAANSYSQEKPASFSNAEPVYYIKTEKGFIKKPKSVKDITEQFPDKKEAIETFVKSNKIKFGKEEDLIKLVNFLNQ
ncbi:hypothetical protein SAMN05421664_1118 [Chryseobacterium soldanellicola]|uniref:GLPGLI family protein n=1 Tax=Chryseobacterium soldanellicola TaxID=311333 RepID=A0A1H0ZWW6_9FLAO|nr:hypothetical protein [Chryseobacterium soldanellicola]SDQ31849.1 hypothetical protein SAMN05421664_1118 [Chryseobacterium soldanellicola]